MISATEELVATDLFHMREFMGQRGIMFCFTGYMTEAVLSGLASAVRQKMEVEDVDRKTVKGLFSIFVELVQNVIRYSAEMDVLETAHSRIDLRYGVITVGKQNGGYYVACGNMINNADIERLAAGLKEISSLDREGLKALYKQTLKNPTPATSKGAGVGFIEIARQAPDGFAYDFKPIDEHHSFFALRASV